MAFSYLTNVPLEQAKQDYLRTLEERGFTARTARIRVQDACGRITARAVYARSNAPHYACSAMDGIALRAGDSFGATDTTPVTLRKGQFTVVDTGDSIPEGCDAVIMVEELVKNDDGSLTIRAPAAPWQHIRQIGEDICAGEMILPSFTEITPAAVGACIAGGVRELDVLAKPVVGIIPTGDEIVPPCADPKPGEILEFNSSIFSAMLAGWGAEARVYPIVPDKFEQIRDTLRQAAADCDLVILNAGSSAGRDDYSVAAVREVGEVLCHGLAVKPGKPAILGYKGAVPILGVPGYPVSGILVIEELLRPLIDRWYGRESEGGSCVRARLTRPVVSGLKYQEYVRVRMGCVGDTITASPLPRGSGVVSSFMKADGFAAVLDGMESERLTYMYNYFVPCGPSADPAGVKEAADVKAAFAAIADGKFSFISRGDGSGTHTKELSLWPEELGITAEAESFKDYSDWYVSANAGMGACLVMAEEKGAYILTDKATFLTFVANEGKID